jgi:hypothetical protein
MGLGRGLAQGVAHSFKLCKGSFDAVTPCNSQLRDSAPMTDGASALLHKEEGCSLRTSLPAEGTSCGTTAPTVQ